jgi:small subunit ribosomal protein S8
MSITDPIADYLTRIRNATKARHSKVDIPASNILKEITRILMEEGYIRDFTLVDDNNQGIVRIYLKYDKDQRSAITGMRRFSRPGYRHYAGANTIPRVLNGLGISILTTSKGLLTGKQARKEKIGGEVLCIIW